MDRQPDQTARRDGPLRAPDRSRSPPMLLSDEEKAEVWPELTKAWPTFDRYVEVSGRNLRVFRLVPK